MAQEIRYPKQLENQYSNFFRGFVKRFFDDLTKRALGLLAEEIESTTLTNQVVVDAPLSLNERLERLKDLFNSIVGSKKTEREIRRQLKLLDAWTIAQLKKVLSPDIVGVLFGTRKLKLIETVNPIGTKNGIATQTLEKAVSTNVNLIKTIGSDFFDTITQTIRKGIRTGQSLKSITKELQRRTGVIESRAAFWARDQVSKTMGELNKQRQLSAGFDSFVWRTVGDNRVRSSHSILNGQIFSWSQGAPINTLLDGRTEGIVWHIPGGDFNCRCTATPVDTTLQSVV